jgi:5'-nucleotidase
MKPVVKRVNVEGIDEAWTVSGPPALCVMFARLGAFGPPFDLLVAGINPGANVGRSVYHSGTIGAALTARNGGISGVAVSQDVDVSAFGAEGQAWGDLLVNQQWDAAADVASQFVEGLVKDLPRDPVVVNINVPNTRVDQMKGWRYAKVGVEPPRNLASAVLEPTASAEGVFTVKIGWGTAMDLPPDEDGAIVADGTVAVTYLTRMIADQRDDLNEAELTLSRLLDQL